MRIPNLDKDPTGLTFLIQKELADLGFYKGAVDNWRGPKTDDALKAFRKAITPTGTVSGMASSFADPADVQAFRRCKATGKSDQQCFKVGDNGIGCWGDDTTTNEPMCALPPDDMIDRWGSIDAAKHKMVIVNARGRSFQARLADRLPWKVNIVGQEVIDLNPGSQKLLGLNPPFMIPVTWMWADDSHQT